MLTTITTEVPNNIYIITVTANDPSISGRHGALLKNGMITRYTDVKGPNVCGEKADTSFIF